MQMSNVKWHQLTPEESVRQQKSNAVLGLTAKAARSRLRKNGANTLFDKKTSAGFSSRRLLLTDPALWLMLLAILLCFFFSEIAAGVCSAVMFGGALVFLAFLVRRFDRMASITAHASVPSVTVIRDGKPLSVSARDVVAGDLVYLKAGDIVPCDCRLLQTDASFACLTRYPDRDGSCASKHLPKNAATVYPYKAQCFAPFFENMVYGTSEILSGSAYALAVEVGVFSFCGAMQVYRAPQSDDRSSACADAVEPLLRVFSLFSFVLLVPIVLIGLFTAPKDASLLRIFAPACALLAGGSKAVISLLFRAIELRAAEQIYDCSPQENRALLKGNDVDEALASMTDLLVLGTYATSDGVPRLFRCAIGNGELSTRVTQPMLRPLCEAYCLLREAERRLPLSAATMKDSSTERIFEDLFSLCPVDTEALAIRVLSSRLSIESSEGSALEVRTAEQAYRIVFAHGDGILPRLTSFENAEGRTLPLSAEQRANLEHFARDAQADGAKIVTVVKQIYRTNVLLGVIAVREQLQALLPSTIEELRQCGVRVSFFFDEPREEVVQYASALGLSAVAPDAALPEDTQEMLQYYAKYRVYAGVDRKKVSALVHALSSCKRRVAVLGGTPEDLSVMSSASVKIACDALTDAKGTSKEEQEKRLPANIYACQTVRAHADMLICRSGALAGGLPAVLQAFSFARASKLRAKLLLRYLFCSNLLRWGLCSVALLFGIGLPSAAQLLFCGLGTDLLAYVWILRLPILQGHLRKRPRFDPPRAMQCVTDRALWGAPLTFAGVFSLCVGVLGRLHVLPNAAAVSVMFFSLLLCELVILYLHAFRSGYPVIGKIWLLPLAALLPALLLLLASLLHPQIGSALELRAWNGWGILLTVASPAVLTAFISLFSHIRPSSRD